MTTKWTPSDFLDKAQELTRRLKGWHYDTDESIDMPGLIEMQKPIRQTFRDRVLVVFGDHDSDGRPGNSQNLFGLEFDSGEVDEMCESDEQIVGYTLENLPSEFEKSLTTWLFRDFYEHLPDAGDSDDAKFLKLKVDRILDLQVYQISKCPIGDYVGGCPVDVGFDHPPELIPG